MSEAEMWILKKTEYSINEILFLVLSANESYSTSIVFVCREFIYLFIYGHG